MQTTTFPLLQSQLDIYWAWTADPSSTGYNLPAVLPFPKTIDTDFLQAALQKVIDVRPVLHTRFTSDAHGQPRQWADMQMEVSVGMCQMSEDEAQDYMSHHFVRPFTPDGSEPLCRFELISTPKHNYLLLDIHHTIADGYTIARNLLGRDLQTAINALPVVEAPSGVPVLYEAAVDEATAFASPAYDVAREHFRKLFEGVDFVRFGRAAATPWGEAAVATSTVPQSAVDNWCRAHSLSAAHLFMAAFSLVLARLKSETRVAYFVLNHGRAAVPGLRVDRRLLADAYGMFVKSVPFVAHVDGDVPLSEFLHQHRAQLMSAMRHGVYPASHFCRDMQVTPSVTFAFQGTNILEELTIGGATIVGRQLPHGRVSNDLGCLVYVKGGNYEIRADSSTALNSLATLQLVADSVGQCVLNMMRGEDLLVGDISIINDAQQQVLIALGQGIEKSQSSKFTVCDLILQQARRSSDALAVADEEGTITYAQLDQLSANMARELRAQGFRTGDFVCLLSAPRKEFVVLVLAVWRAGGAYVPLDGSQPEVRLHAQMNECGARLILSDRPLVADAPFSLSTSFEWGSRHLYIYTSTSKLKTLNPIADTTYMMFTSGTTGQPKGVVVPHRAVANLVSFIAREWKLCSQSRICCHSSFAFDASVEDLFPALTVGGSVHIVPERARRDVRLLHQFLCDQHITGGCFTTRLGLLLADFAPLPLQYICLGGERLTRCPQTTARIINTYGPTECCVDATWCELNPDTHYDDIPIGRPLPNVQVYVADQHGQLLPRGAVGELLLGGVQLADGYWQQPALTAERFVESKFGVGRVYRTGDLVRWGNDGLLYFVGRSDQQLKIDGHRIEPAEVEQALLQTDGISQAVVAMRQQGSRQQLCAYYTGRRPLSDTSLRTRLAQLLPAYMIPSRFVFMRQLPTGTNGKVDYDQLPLPEDKPSAVSRKSAVTKTEQMLCEAFATVLQCGNVGPDDNFFELGGSSIMVMQLVVEAGRRGLELVYGDVYRWPTPAALAEGMKNRECGSAEARGYEKSLGNGNANCEGNLAPPHPRTSVPTNTPVLLTGATGLLGSHVLRQLLADEGTKVVCLVRTLDGSRGIERLRKTMSGYFGPEETESLLERVEVAEGDLTCDDAFDALADADVQRVIHCAADVRHYAADDQLEAVNVGGTRRVVDFCIEKRCPLTHVSTTSVLMRSTNEYVRTKAMAEQVVMQAVSDRGLQATVMRIGNLMPRQADGRYQSDAEANAMLASMRLMASMGAYPEVLREVAMDLSPVDEVARALVSLVRVQSSVNNVFTVCHWPFVNMGDVLEKYGGARSVTAIRFQELLSDTPDTHRKAALFGLLSMLGGLLPQSADAWLQSLRQIDEGAAQTARLLSDMGLAWPRLTDRFFGFVFG